LPDIKIVPLGLSSIRPLYVAANLSFSFDNYTNFILC